MKESIQREKYKNTNSSKMAGNIQKQGKFRPAGKNN